MYALVLGGTEYDDAIVFVEYPGEHVVRAPQEPGTYTFEYVLYSYNPTLSVRPDRLGIHEAIGEVVIEVTE